MPDESVHCVVTSPPYWGLRDYKTVGQLGLERTPEEYVSKMVEVFREVKRVLRSDGTCWVNMGDSYSGSWGNYVAPDSLDHRVGMDKRRKDRYGTFRPHAADSPNGLKPKDLCGIPWRLAFALQADGWYLRSDIIWSKRNPMPESVTDRPTKAHEYIFLLAKSERYFYDAEAVKEPVTSEFSLERGKYTRKADLTRTFKQENPPDDLVKVDFLSAQNGYWPSSRNKRSVWEMSTQPFPQAHFATFPPELPEICIKAGTSEKGCCKECGAPWERVIEKTEQPAESHRGSRFDTGKTGVNGNGRTQEGERYETKTLGWEPTCKHSAEVVPATVLDPFSGAGTTGLVATRLCRSYIGIELNADYVEMAKDRITNDAPLFNTFPAELAEGGLGTQLTINDGREDV